MTLPGYWQNETGAVLRPAVRKYLAGGELGSLELAAVRGYLRQWLRGDFRGPDVDELRDAVDAITSTQHLRAWLAWALNAGIDPL